jgi:hypothetical protein
VLPLSEKARLEAPPVLMEGRGPRHSTMNLKSHPELFSVTLPVGNGEELTYKL